MKDSSNKSTIALAGLLAVIIYIPFIHLLFQQSYCAEKYKEPRDIMRCESQYTRMLLWLVVIFIFVRLSLVMAYSS